MYSRECRGGVLLLKSENITTYDLLGDYMKKTLLREPLKIATFKASQFQGFKLVRHLKKDFLERPLKVIGLSLIAACSLCACKERESSIKTDVEYGEMGQTPQFLLDASKISRSIDPEQKSVMLFYNRDDCNYDKWGLWLWGAGYDGSDDDYIATRGKFKTEGSTGLGYIDLTNLIELSDNVKDTLKKGMDLNMIIRDDNWNKDPGCDQVLALTSGARHFVVNSGDETVYPVTEFAEPSIRSAFSIDDKRISVSLTTTYGLSGSKSDSGFVITDGRGKKLKICDVVNKDFPTDKSKNNATDVIIIMDKPLDPMQNYSVSHPSFESGNKHVIYMTAAVKASLISKMTDVANLGLKLKGNGKADFATWAPYASELSLLLYKSYDELMTLDAEPVVLPLKKDEKSGRWSITNIDVTPYKYYKYRIINGSDVNEVADIYSYVCAPDSIASQIVSIDDSSAVPEDWELSYTNPFGNSGKETKKYSDAVIFEMHVKDWGMGAVTDSTGKFLDIASDKMISHLKDLGVTHVQLLPSFDYAQTNSDPSYNWGYNPYHYNVPEGRYATTGYTDGTVPVKEMRTMIKALHDAGIAVNMDVVYNHTSGTRTDSLYDMTVPYYYYRFTEDGAYGNGSGCGNETDTEAPMFRSYMIESLKHWMKDYHINGFRFDLMGVHSREAMKEIYEALYVIDKNVMVYGEPWTGGTSLVSNTTSQALKADSGYGIAVFDDDFRDAIKGKEFGGFQRGQVQGCYSDEDIVNGLIGKAGPNHRNDTGLPSLAIHYVECHDNYTLADKLSLSLNDTLSDDLNVCPYIAYDDMTAEQKEAIRAEDKLAAAYVLLSQGTAFINGGQEFMRTKQGNPDSYSADTKGGKTWSNADILKCNVIDFSYKEKFADVYKTYKGLIALRQSDTHTFGDNTEALAWTLSEGFTKYTTGDYCIYFNATDKEAAIETSGYTKNIDVTEGFVAESSVLPESVSAKNFVILKK